MQAQDFNICRQGSGI